VPLPRGYNPFENVEVDYTEDAATGEKHIKGREPVQSMLKPEAFHELSLALEGTFEIQKPHVPRHVMVKALRQQNITLKDLRVEHNAAILRIDTLETEVDKQNAKIENMEERLQETEESLKLAHQILEEHEEKLKKLDKIDELEEKIKVHEERLDRQAAQIQDNKAEFTAYKRMNDQRAEEARKERDAVEARVKINEEKLEIFGDDMKIQSDDVLVGEAQVTLTAFSIRMDSLLEDLEKTTTQNNKILKAHGEDLDGKAPLSLEAIVGEHERALKEFSEMLKGSGASDLQSVLAESKRTMEENTAQLEEVHRQLLNKMDRDKVDEKIERKYEEIIEHLQSALSSANEDEDEFKRVCAQLQDMCNSLSNNKADKKELLEIKEQVLFDSRMKDQVENMKKFLDSRVTKDQLGQAMESKISREELQKHLNALSENTTQFVLQQMENLQGGGGGAVDPAAAAGGKKQRGSATKPGQPQPAGSNQLFR
jgi:hypothetical protein